MTFLSPIGRITLTYDPGDGRELRFDRPARATQYHRNDTQRQCQNHQNDHERDQPFQMSLAVIPDGCMYLFHPPDIALHFDGLEAGFSVEFFF